MNTKQSLEKIANLAAARAWAQLTRRYGAARLGECPSVIMNNRLKTTAGRAWLEAGKIDISTSLMLDFPRRIIMDTIPHECAHIAALRVYNYGLQRGESHGKPWAEMMDALGLPASIYHDMIEQRTLKQLRK